MRSGQRGLLGVAGALIPVFVLAIALKKINRTESRIEMNMNDKSTRTSTSQPFSAAASLQALRLPAHEVSSLRQTLHQQCPRFIDGALIRFVHQAFAMDEVVEAYFWPRQPEPKDYERSGLQPRVLIPFEEARRAAGQAQQMAVLQSLTPFSRHLAALASLLYPCGWFLHAHPAFRFPQPDFQPSRVYVKKLGFVVLERALQELRLVHQGISDTLATALGYRTEEGLNVDVNSHLATAVYLSNLRVMALWSPQ